jgi:hypothetical protein
LIGELRGCRGVDEKGVVSETRVKRVNMFGNNEKAHVQAIESIQENKFHFILSLGILLFVLEFPFIRLVMWVLWN